MNQNIGVVKYQIGRWGKEKKLTFQRIWIFNSFMAHTLISSLFYCIHVARGCYFVRRQKLQDCFDKPLCGNLLNVHLNGEAAWLSFYRDSWRTAGEKKTTKKSTSFRARAAATRVPFLRMSERFKFAGRLPYRGKALMHAVRHSVSKRQLKSERGRGSGLISRAQSLSAVYTGSSSRSAQYNSVRTQQGGLKTIQSSSRNMFP